MLLMCAFTSFPAHAGRSKSFRVPHAFGKSKLHQISKAKSSKFLTGLAAGSLLFSQRSSNSASYNENYNLSSYDELYVEYERNNQLLEKGNLSKEKKLTLERRNQQIKNILVREAEHQYIASFSLQLIPLKEKVIETKKGESDALIKNHDIQVKRKQIVYQMSLSRESPKPISDFEIISINDMKPNNLKPYKFSYSEKWGENIIKVRLRDKGDERFEFELTKSYYVQKAREIDFVESVFEKLWAKIIYFLPIIFIWLTLGSFINHRSQE